MVDNKLRILAAMKEIRGDRLTTVFPRQGHYALDPKNIAIYPPADLTVERIGDRVNYDLSALLDEKAIWQERYRSVVDLEAHLHRNGTRIIKFFLHQSKDEQRKRFLKRIDNPDKKICPRLPCSPPSKPSPNGQNREA